MCPHCHSTLFNRFGKYDGMQRYRCKRCERTFIPTTGSAIYYLHKKDQFIDSLHILKNEGVLTLDKMKKRMNICKQTAFDWRHKLLMTLVNKKILLKNEINFEEVKMNFTVKGRRNAKIKSEQYNIKTTKDLLKMSSVSGQEKLKIKIARVGFWLSTKDVKRTVGGSIKEGSRVFCSLKHLLKYIEKEKNLKIEERKEENYKIKSFLERNMLSVTHFKDIIRYKFRGVATKYMQIYSSYFMVMDKVNLFSDFKLLTQDIFVWFTFIRMENLYRIFLTNFSLIPYTVSIKRKWKTMNFNSLINVF